MPFWGLVSTETLHSAHPKNRGKNGISRCRSDGQSKTYSTYSIDRELTRFCTRRLQRSTFKGHIHFCSTRASVAQCAMLKSGPSYDYTTCRPKLSPPARPASSIFTVSPLPQHLNILSHQEALSAYPNGKLRTAVTVYNKKTQKVKY